MKSCLKVRSYLGIGNVSLSWNGADLRTGDLFRVGLGTVVVDVHVALMVARGSSG